MAPNDFGLYGVLGNWHLRSASRKRLWGGIRLDYNGFRIARTIS